MLSSKPYFMRVSKGSGETLLLLSAVRRDNAATK
jgi:hypothetical protein